MPFDNTEVLQQPPTPVTEHIERVTLVARMDVHDLMPFDDTEVYQQPPTPTPPMERSTRVTPHSNPFTIVRWHNDHKLRDCISYADKFIYVCTCCNFRYQPGCDTEGHCYCCGNDHNVLSNGVCSCLSPSICCCCPCILLALAGCCDNAQKCCRGDNSY